MMIEGEPVQHLDDTMIGVDGVLLPISEQRDTCVHCSRTSKPVNDVHILFLNTFCVYIGGSKGCAREARPISVQCFFNFMQFLGNWPKTGWRPHLRGWCSSRLGNRGSSTAVYMSNELLMIDAIRTFVT